MAGKLPKLSKMEIEAFRAQIWAFYRHSGRKMPWRSTQNPYKILVSEVMLQQTQVPRVLEKYPEFLKKFPTITVLANAPLSDVLRVWQGMGYNRRARYLRDSAQVIVRDYHNRFPKTETELCALPGIGHYTTNAILTFAYDEPRVFIETNIRRIFIHHFFNIRRKVSDAEILPLVQATLDTKNPREWYYALMDYGSQLPKATRINANIQSKHYVKQSTFVGSTRELRGKIIMSLSARNQTLKALRHICNKDPRTQQAINTLIKDKLIKKLANRRQEIYSLA